MWSYRHGKQNRHKLYVWTASALLVGGLLILIVLSLTRQPVIPVAIRKQITFPILFFADSNSPVSLQKNTIKYDKPTHLLSFIVNIRGKNAAITVSEQASPPEFAEVPRSYTALLQKLNSYATYDSRQGTFSLVKPAQLGSGQSAVMNTKGTLLFMKSSDNLSDDQWRIIFNNLYQL